MEKLKMAVLYGADAVYLGGKAFGLRAFGGNFGRDELRAAMDFVHSHGRKAYVTVNIFAHNADLAGLPDYLRFLRDIKADAVLVADLGVFMLAREIVPELPLHVSTQANNVNWRTVAEWQKLGAQRVVLARELSLAEIREIRSRCDVELEMFVHGAMCISYSGRCLLSNYMAGRDANRGSCAQACRWNYKLVEETRPGQYFPVAEDGHGAYILNSKDLCLLPYLPEIIDCGIDSLKIEGRMKSVHYTASVTKAYRMAIDSFCHDPAHFSLQPSWQEELEKVSHRAYTTGFFCHQPTEADQIYGSSSYEQSSEFIGLVLAYDKDTGWAEVEQRNNMKRGQEIEVFQPTGPLYRQMLTAMLDMETGMMIDVAPHAQQRIKIHMDQPVEPYTILRRDI
jgi:putative protease